MSTIKSQLEYTNETKNLIKQEIIKKGVAVSDADTFRAYPQKIKEIQQEYPPKQTGQLLVTWFDYDGTVLKAKWYNYGDFMSKDDFPEIISKHDGLIFAEWNYTPEEIGAIRRYYDISAIYDTEDGSSRLVVQVDGRERVSVRLMFGGEECSIKWGDGSPAESFAYMPAMSVYEHTYTSGGIYFINIAKKGTRYLYLSLSQLVSGGGADNTPGARILEANINNDFRFLPFDYQPLGAQPRKISFSSDFAGHITEAGGARFVGTPRRASCWATCHMEYISLPKKAHFVNSDEAFSGKIKRVCADTFSTSPWFPAVISCCVLNSMTYTGTAIDVASEKTITLCGSGTLTIDDYIFYFRTILIFSEKKLEINIPNPKTKFFREIYVLDKLVQEYEADAKLSAAKIYIKPLSSFSKNGV